MIYATFDTAPVIRQMADPVIAGALVALTLSTIVAVALAPQLAPGDVHARWHVIQIAFGLVVVLGVYFTAVGIRAARAQHYSERLATVLAHLNSDSVPVRLGAIRLLQAIALEEPDLPGGEASKRAHLARMYAIRETLDAMSHEPESRCASLARETLNELADSGVFQTSRPLD